MVVLLKITIVQQLKLIAFCLSIFALFFLGWCATPYKWVHALRERTTYAQTSKTGLLEASKSQVLHGMNAVSFAVAGH